MNTATRKSSNWGNFFDGLEQKYPVYETALSVRTEMEEMPSFSEFPSAARLSEFVAELKELMGRMNPASYAATSPHLRLVGGMPPKT